MMSKSLSTNDDSCLRVRVYLSTGKMEEYFALVRNGVKILDSGALLVSSSETDNRVYAPGHWLKADTELFEG